MSSMLMNLKRLSPVLVMTSSMYVPTCNSFCTVRANSGKITSFREYSSLTLSFEGNSCTQRAQNFFHEKLETLRQSMVKIL